jgi:signal transduction histidine kinase
MLPWRSSVFRTLAKWRTLRGTAMTPRNDGDVSGSHERDLARDVHDALGPTLVGAALLAKSLERAVPEALRAPVARLVELLGEATDETRRLARGRRPASADLPRELERLADLCENVMGVACVIGGNGAPRIAAEGDGAAVLLLVREAVTNAIRHGKARHVDITLLADGALRTVVVADDGAGLGSVPAEGVGLVSMRARAESLGGRLTVESPAVGGSTPAGTVVTCVFRAREVRS